MQFGHREINQHQHPTLKRMSRSVSTFAAIDGWPTTDDTTPVSGYMTDLVDLNVISLADLVTIENPVLQNSLRRVLDEADRDDDIVAGFQSAI
jgi:FXSXX-COOH protein